MKKLIPFLLLDWKDGAGASPCCCVAMVQVPLAMWRNRA